MPYYQDRIALSPLNSDVVTADKIERLLTSSVVGFSGTAATPQFSCRQNAVESYKGFYVPRSIEIWSEDGRTYVLTLLGDVVDARFFERGKNKSPWIEVSGRSPTLEEIEAYWRPVTDPAMQRHVESAFRAVEQHMLGHHMADVTEEEKLQHIDRRELDWNSLGQFCTILGGYSQETHSFIEDHVMFAAYNPQNYLKTRGLIDDMTLDDCREFSWRSLIFDNESHFCESGHLSIVDWKCEGDEVECRLNQLLQKERPGKADRICLLGDGVMSATDEWLIKASVQLERMGLHILLLDSGGDNFAFTLADRRKARTLVSLGKTIGLTTEIFPAPQPNRQGWFRGLLSRLSR